jgi:hypothetical protein
MKRPNPGLVRTDDPRHASCLRTCRAAGRLSAQPERWQDVKDEDSWNRDVSTQPD